jgi:hypothetical protein
VLSRIQRVFELEAVRVDRQNGRLPAGDELWSEPGFAASAALAMSPGENNPTTAVMPADRSKEILVMASSHYLDWQALIGAKTGGPDTLVYSNSIQAIRGTPSEIKSE